MVRHQKPDFRQGFSPTAKSESWLCHDHTPQAPALNFVSSSSKHRPDQDSNQPPSFLCIFIGNSLLIELPVPTPPHSWEGILMCVFLLPTRSLRHPFIIFFHLRARAKTKLKQTFVFRSPHQSFSLCTFFSFQKQNKIWEAFIWDNRKLYSHIRTANRKATFYFKSSCYSTQL